VAGKVITLGGKEWEILPLTLAHLKNGVLEKIYEHDKLVEAEKPYEAMILKGEIITTALQRTHPELTFDEVAAMLDLENFREAWLVVLGLSGLGEVPGAERGLTTSAPSSTSSPAPTGGTMTPLDC
jgi:hypothetical protein